MENEQSYFRELQPGMTLQNGKYIIERVLGAGGFGITYYARHTSLDQHYAIKEFFIDGRCVRNTMRHTVNLQGIEPDMFEKYRKKFTEEAQTLAKLDHPNIVRVIDVFEENETSYIVMPFIEGKTLENLVEKNGPLDYGLTVNYIGQIASAVGYIHKRNILHRDIKPDNIMITADNHAILIDFGSAREFIQDKTQHQTSILTKGYAPIEQYSSNSRKGAYTDIYSLGAVLYYVLTGTKPMDATERLSEMMPEPKEINPQIGEDVNRTIMKAMQLKHENRHQTIDEFMNDLLGTRPSAVVKEEPLIKETPQPQTQPNPAPQPQKPVVTGGVNRRTILIAVICGLVVIVIGAIIGIVISANSGSGTIISGSPSEEKSPIEPIPGYPMVWVEGGKFIRGDVAAQMDDDNYTTNTDSIEVSGFYMGIHEVSQEIWERVMGSNPSHNDGDKRNPVENVSYVAVSNFINKANTMFASKLQHKKLALPTEAEWEYAAGGGKLAKRKAIYSGGPLDGNSWYYDNANGRTHPVGILQPNRLGIFDMTGNVCEWCQDYYSEDFYKLSSKKNPLNTQNADYGHVYRGGCFRNGREDSDLKITFRDFLDEDQSDRTIGFRLVLK